MNELIKLLSDKAIEIVANKRTLADGQIERTWRPEYYDQVFAKLIVKECACLSYLDDSGNPEVEEALEFWRKNMLKHFGVEL